MTEISSYTAQQLNALLGEGYLSALTGYLPADQNTDDSDSRDAALNVLKAAFPDGEVIQQPPRQQTRKFIRDPDGAIRRLRAGQLGTWMRHAAKAGGCTQPIRLSGHHIVANKTTGEVVEHFDTADLPDGVLYQPCGTRRASQCPACARTYKYDAHQLIRAGLSGGKGVSSSVAAHPAVFVTFTAPSFGPVHSRIVKHHACHNRGNCTCVPLPCRARRDNPTCVHGRLMSCTIRHNADDPRLGHPLCADCYDYDAHVVWNYFSGKLWSRTVDQLRRFTTRVGTKVRYAKVAEVQRRGAVHFHVIMRLDGDNTNVIAAPPIGLGIDFLTEVLRHAAHTTFTTPPHPHKANGWDIGWGQQLDIQPLRRGVGDGELSDRYVRYLAKYATKSTESLGLNTRRLTSETIEQFFTPTHVGKLIAACWRLGHKPLSEYTAQILTVDNRIIGSRDRWVCQNGHPRRRTRLHHCAACGSSNDASSPQPAPRSSGKPGHSYEKMRRWAHTLGFGGHFLTKSRKYSVTFGHLRAARRNHHTPDLDSRDDTTLVVLRQWMYRGSGWETTADAELALQAADSARARQPLFRAY